MSALPLATSSRGRRWRTAVYAVVVALWVGSLWTVGYLVAPVLFSYLHADRSLAGNLAGAVFSVETKLGLACAALVLALRFARSGGRALREWQTVVVLAMAAITLVGYLAVTPLLVDLKAGALAAEGVEVMRSTLASRFAFWHGVSSVLYLIQSLLGAALVASLRSEP